MRCDRSVWVMVVLIAASAGAAEPAPFDFERAIDLSDDASWCWFQDERAIIAGQTLIVGAVASGHAEPQRRGSVEVLTLDLPTGVASRSTLHPAFETDDHDAPAFVRLDDGAVLAAYSKHHRDNRFYLSRSSPSGGYRDWTAPRAVTPSEPSRLTYTNLLLSKNGPTAGRLYNLFRGLDDSFKPSYAYSDDQGETWTAGGVLIDVPSNYNHRPYTKYAMGADGAVHIAYTEGHPRDYDNSVYHAVLRDGRIETTRGDPIAAAGEPAPRPERGEPVFRGDADRVAWTHDLHLDSEGRPVIAFSVQMNSAGLPVGRGGDDLRYGYARWDGALWRSRLIGHAGSRLYAGEDDYAGGVCLDPQRPGVVYCSADVDPNTGDPTASGRYELFVGVAGGEEGPFRWTPLTPGTSSDCFRPIVPIGRNGWSALVWLEGEYRSYTDFRQRARAVVHHAGE